MKCACLLLVAILSLSAIGVPATARAEDRGLAAEAGLGIGSAVINMVYGPFKVLYAAVGTLTASIAYVCTGADGEIASKIMNRSVRGDYAITPEILTGEKTWVVTGPDPGEPAQQSW